MNGRILERYTSLKADEPERSSTLIELDGTEDCGAFHFLRGIRDLARMLQLRKRSGEILAVGYGYIDRVLFEPSIGITLRASGEKILIRGRNLNSEVRPTVCLLEGIMRQRVTRITECDESSNLFANVNDVVIEAIEW